MLPVAPLMIRKPRTVTAYDAFCKQGPAPPGSDFIGKCCNLSDLSSAHKAAWDKLTPEE